MAKIHKNKNPNRKRLSVLLVMQVVFAVLPVILLLYFLSSMDNFHNYVFAYIIVAAMVLCGSAYFFLARQYSILLSGIKGERSLYKIAKRLEGSCNVYLNLPVRYKKNRSEIDMLVVSEKGVLVIEAKNHSGFISGNDTDQFWRQYKRYKDGRETCSEIENPVRQVNRQREILKNILKSEGVNLWIYCAVYYSNPFVKLDLTLRDTSIVIKGENELLNLIKYSDTKERLQPEVLSKINEIVTNLEV